MAVETRIRIGPAVSDSISVPCCCERCMLPALEMIPARFSNVELDWKLRFEVRRILAYVVIAVAPAALFGQDSPQTSQHPDTSSTESAAALSQSVIDAEAAIVKSDWKGAEAKLNPWLSEHPGDARALFDAGYAADAQNKLEDAAALYRRAVESDPKRFEARLSLGLLLARQNKIEEARTELAAATTLDPGDAGTGAKARAWRALAQIDRDVNPTEASNDLLEALKLSPETAEDTLLAAELAEKAGQSDAAEAAYRRMLAHDATNRTANAGLAHIYIERKQYPEAETFLRAALEKSPDDPALTAQLATVLAAQDKAEALPMLQKLHAAHPADPAITRMLAEVLAEAGDPAGSDQLFLSLLAAHPDDAALLIAHGQNLIRQQRYPEAFAAFTQATTKDAGNPDGWSGLAFAASKVGRPAITVQALTMRSKYVEDVPSTYFLWATSYDSLHDKAAAITYYHHFLQSAAGKYPDQEFQARQRLLLLEKK
ncbi:MAG TPA: tetratricopeptide repeat protein [Terracidiphilus sp.]|jgi:predicted Zn-dependent protease